ncbi:hypothetical protein BTHE68_58500 (plasmid) [Burkholderia sp. THE68]|nr:hypothetical protein BTHE68_58500 [Burkholderia sp. THE68]
MQRRTQLESSPAALFDIAAALAFCAAALLAAEAVYTPEAADFVAGADC